MTSVFLAEITMRSGTVVRTAFATRARAWRYVNEFCEARPHGEQPTSVHVRQVDFINL